MRKIEMDKHKLRQRHRANDVAVIKKTTTTTMTNGARETGEEATAPQLLLAITSNISD